MKYTDFEHIISAQRMQKYLAATNNNTRKAMTLYRLNLRLSQEMFTVVSCFEVALRNTIDNIMVQQFGIDWLRDSVQPGGIFDSQHCEKTKSIITKAYNKLTRTTGYTPTQLLSSMEFGVWKYMYSPYQYVATGQVLLGVFPNKPSSTIDMQLNHSHFFNELDKVNKLRNRIAHHEPICFVHGITTADSSYIITEYQKILVLFNWMGIESTSLLYGLDHIRDVCSKIDNIQ